MEGMTIQQIIDVLNKVEDKSTTWIPVTVVNGYDENGRSICGSFFEMSAELDKDGKVQIIVR